MNFKRVEQTVLRRICCDYVTRFDDLSVMGQIRTRGAYNRRGENGSFQQLSPKHSTENQNGMNDYRPLDPQKE